jgi:uncharacterized membrane protein YcaP (DUF421 family)
LFFDNVSGLVRVLVVGPLAYVWLIAVLRCSGKRTLAQLNAFDFIVMVALGSTLATVALSSTVAWSEGALALVLLAALQFVVAWSSVHVPWVRSAGIGGLELVSAVVLECNGTISVISTSQHGSGSAITGVAARA